MICWLEAITKVIKNKYKNFKPGTSVLWNETWKTPYFLHFSVDFRMTLYYFFNGFEISLNFRVFKTLLDFVVHFTVAKILELLKSLYSNVKSNYNEPFFNIYGTVNEE